VGPFTVVRVVRWAQRDQICIYRPYAAKAQTEGWGVIWFLVLDMHLLIRAIGNNRLGPPVPERTDPPDQHTMGPFALPPKIVAMIAIMIEQTK
jgi:hypothetical protein